MHNESLTPVKTFWQVHIQLVIKQDNLMALATEVTEKEIIDEAVNWKDDAGHTWVK